MIMASEFISGRAPASIIVHILVRRLSLEVMGALHLIFFYMILMIVSGLWRVLEGKFLVEGIILSQPLN